MRLPGAILPAASRPLRRVRDSVRAFLLATPVVLAGCAHALPRPEADRLLDVLFAPPTAEEIAAVEADWAGRDTGVRGYRVERVRRHGRTGRTLVVSHTVGGVRHYGAVRVPDGAGGRRLPVLVIAHGGEDGATGYNFLRSGPVAERWIQVLPSFRGEGLRLTPFRWHLSEGPPSPWDRDVDDSMALLSAVLAHFPEADPGRVALFGRSRGAGVALLMAARDPRVKGVVDFYGPTDFFLPHVRALAGRALRTRLPSVPGAGYLADSVLFALRDGRTTVARARLELLRRSPAYFAHRLPPVQAHYGTADPHVPVEHGERLDAAMRRLGRTSGRWEYHRYVDGGHHPGSLSGSRRRAELFLRRVAEPGATTTPSSPVP